MMQPLPVHAGMPLLWAQQVKESASSFVTIATLSIQDNKNSLTRLQELRNFKRKWKLHAQLQRKLKKNQPTIQLQSHSGKCSKPSKKVNSPKFEILNPKFETNFNVSKL